MRPGTLLFATTALVMAACSSVPDVVFDDEDGGVDGGGASSSSGGTSLPDAAPPDASSSSGGSTCSAKLGEVCCGPVPCRGLRCLQPDVCDRCQRSGDGCAGKRCCPEKNKCVELDKDC